MHMGAIRGSRRSFVRGIVRLNSIASAVVLLVTGLVGTNPVDAQTCTGEDSSNAVTSTQTTQDSGEGTSSETSPSDNTQKDTDTPAGQSKPDSSGSAKSGDSGDGGGAGNGSGGTDIAGSASNILGEDDATSLSSSSLASYVGDSPGAALAAYEASRVKKTFKPIGDPIDVAAADKTHVQVDYLSLGANPIRMARSYHSNAAENPANVTVPMGAGWHMFYDRSLQQLSSSAIRLHRANGSVVDFTYNGSTWLSAISAGVLAPVSGGWAYYNLRDTIETYDANGRLIGMSDEGLITQLQYDANGRLASVHNAFGRSLTFAYDGSGRVATVGLPDATHLSYGYDGAGNLASITFNDGSVRQYVYENSSYPHALTGVVDESGRRSLTWSYDSAGRPNGSFYGANQNPTTISYNGSQVVTTDARGTQRIRNVAIVNGQSVVTSAQTAATANSAATSWNFAFDAAGNLQSAVTRTGETQQFSMDSRGREVSSTRAVGTSVATTSTTTWHPTFNIPTQTVANGVTTNNTIDAFGHVTQTTQASGSTSVTSYAATYNAQNLLQSTTDARGVVLNYAYDASGNLTSITNASLNQTTTFSNYNANGQPLTIQRPDGVVITRTFDSRGRMTSRTTPDGTTYLSYDASGRLLTTTLPDGSYKTRTYDTAGLLSSVTNNRGEATNILRDVATQVTGTNTYSAAGVLTSQTRRTIDAVGRTAAVVDSRGYSTQLTYGADGRPSGSTDPLGHIRSEQLDPLNRLVSLTQPNTTAMRQAGGAATTTSQFAYSATDNASNVTDTTGVSTGYTYDGLRRRTGEAGNDAGSSGTALNAAGDIVSHTDALGNTIGLTHDAIGRVTAMTYGNTTDRTFSYVPGRSDGLLSGVTASSGDSMAWTYDSAGRMLTQRQTVAGMQQTVTVARDALGRPTSVTYPSGMVLGLTYNADVVSSLTVNGVALLNSVSYLPQTNIATGWQWGNGTHYGKSFDPDGRVTSVTLGSVTRSYGYDAAGQIVAETDTSASGTKQYTFGYDELGQLISYTSPSGNLAYTYDANGNRRSESGTGTPGGYAYVANANRLSSGAGDSYQYNADGTPTTSVTSAQYNVYRQLSQLTLLATQGQYGYNALGQRDMAQIYKSVSCTGGPPVQQAQEVREVQQTLSPTKCWQLTGTRRYVYDAQSRLLGEYDSSSGYSQETVWFNDQPVATVINGVTYYVNADNIGAPRSIVRASDNVEMWRWDSDPFGNSAPTTPNPAAGTITYNLRFPGQIAGIGFYYLNGARDYNAATGRYLEPDPTGLRGGLSRYAYAKGNPIINIDPSGLLTAAAQAIVDAAMTKSGGNTEWAYYDVWNQRSSNTTDPSLAQAEHFLYASDWTSSTYGLAGISLIFAIPLYTGAKEAADLTGLLPPETSKPSGDEISAGYEGIAAGVFNTVKKITPPPNLVKACPHI